MFFIPKGGIRLAPKYRQLLDYIETLPQGETLSVRALARHGGVSEGTAYRAIKEAEKMALVRTIPRVGTVRMDDKRAQSIQELTFMDVAEIVEGVVLGGKEGLEKSLRHFLIAAMELPEAAGYIKEGNLVIVGNRENIQAHALRHGAPVLVTGGFSISREILEIADSRALPLISTTYDTFTTASLIHRALHERMAQKTILLVEDIMVKEVFSLHPQDTVAQWYTLLRHTHHTRFPVIDGEGKVLGMITGKDVAEAEENASIAQVMTRDPLTIYPRASIASAAHSMVWGGIELLPVVDEKGFLQGVISRQDVIQAQHQLQKQPQIGEGPEDMVLRSLRFYEEGSKMGLTGQVTGTMLNPLGVLSGGVLALLFSYLATQALQKQQGQHKGEVEHLNIHNLRPLPLGTPFTLLAEVLEAGHRGGLVEMKIMLQGDKIGAQATAYVKPGI